MGVYSDGSYGIQQGLIYSFPVTCEKGEWKIVQGKFIILSHCKSYYITSHPLHQVISLHSPFELVPNFSMQDSRLTSSRGESLMQLHKSSLRRKHWPIHVSTDNELLFLQIIMIGIQ